MKHLGVPPPTHVPAFGHDELLRRLGAPQAALVEFADPGPDSRVVLIGPSPLGLTRALAGRGVADVWAMRPADRPGFAAADVAIVSEVTDPDLLERAASLAQAVLAPLGTIALHLPVDPDDALVRQTGHLLVLNGFAAVRVRSVRGETLIRAERPAYGGLWCA